MHSHTADYTRLGVPKFLATVRGISKVKGYLMLQKTRGSSLLIPYIWVSEYNTFASLIDYVLEEYFEVRYIFARHPRTQFYVTVDPRAASR